MELLAASAFATWWFKVLCLAIAGLNMLLFATTQRSRMETMQPTELALYVVSGFSRTRRTRT